MTHKALGFDNVLLTVGDLAEAVDFYDRRLGLALAFRLDGPGIALFKVGDETPGLLLRRADGYEPRRPEQTGARVWLEVRDARDAARSLAEAGVEPLAEPFEVATGWTVEVADPWGNVLGFTDYTKRPDAGRP